MLTFHMTMGGEEVKINKKTIGYIDKEGFFLDPTTIKDFTRISPQQLREIADRCVQR